MTDEGGVAPLATENFWRSLLRATLALPVAVLLVIAALYVTFDRHDGAVGAIVADLLFPFAVLAGVAWAFGVWRPRTHVLAQALLVMVGIAVMPLTAFFFEIALACDFAVDNCS